MASSDVNNMSQDDLQQELVRLQYELDEANEEKLKAAEYGLLALGEKQQLQEQFDELEAAHSATRNELDHSLVLLDDLQRERSQREQQDESLRQLLLTESERRESLLVDANNELQETVDKLRQVLRSETDRRQHAETEAKQLLDAESDRLLSNETGAGRTAELERRNQRAEREIEQLREQVAAFEQTQTRAERLAEGLRAQELEQDRLSELVNRLTQELAQTQLDSSQAFANLKEEQEKCRRLEMKLEEMEVSSSFAAGGGESVLDELSHATMATPPPVDDDHILSNGMTSTPFHAHNTSLMSELQSSMPDQEDRVRDLEEALEERSSTIAELNKQLSELRADVETHRNLRNKLQEKQSAVDILTKEVSQLRARSVDIVINGDMMTIPAVEELVTTLQASVRHLSEKLHRTETLATPSSREDTMVGAEHASLLKKIEGLESERATLLLDGEERCEKIRVELFAARDENEKLVTSRDEFEKRCVNVEKRCRTAEEDLAGQKDLLSVLTRETHTLILDVDGMSRLAASLSAKRERTDDSSRQPSSSDLAGGHLTDARQLFGVLREKIRVVKSNVESVLRSSLEKHAVMSSAPGGSSNTTPETSPRSSADSGWSVENKRQAQMRIEKLKRELKTRINEISTLRMVMQANRSTAQAALQREKAVAERKIREAEERVVRARADLERTQRDNSQMATMRSMFSERCEEYIRQVVMFKRSIADLTQEKNELSMLLERAIAQKVRLTEKLEEYEIENERAWNIPQSLHATKV